MAIHPLNLPSNFLKPRPRYIWIHTHLMLAGINQTVFLNQWGQPETQMGLKWLGSFYDLGSLFLITDPTEEARHSVWIYKKRDRILFFTKKRLTSHFRWSEFRENWKRPDEEIDSNLIKKPSVLVATTLALVA